MGEGEVAPGRGLQVLFRRTERRKGEGGILGGHTGSKIPVD